MTLHAHFCQVSRCVSIKFCTKGFPELHLFPLQALQSALYGNPHCTSSSSMRSTARVEALRSRLLDFFGASPEEYEVGEGGWSARGGHVH